MQYVYAHTCQELESDEDVLLVPPKLNRGYATQAFWELVDCRDSPVKHTVVRCVWRRAVASC